MEYSKLRYKEILALIERVEREAAELILQAHGILAEAKTGKRDVVTEYDRRVQELLMERFRDALPEAHFFCEEMDEQDRLDAEQLFIIDPIDGTMNFVHGFHHSCISVAYAERGIVRIGAVYNPYVDEMFTAVAGHGSSLNGRPIHVSDAGLSEGIVCFGSAPYNPELSDRTFGLARTLYDASLDVRREGSAALDLCSVAAGRAGLYFELRVSLWDYAAGALIAEEAGGQCCTADGGCFPADGSKTSILAGSPAAVKDFFRLTAES
ncbi:MAG: inositol monophosphatase [Oscillospiraceae bacterium]|nr:inositol monophosphatase [Oscillospiraceae bacterium]